MLSVLHRAERRSELVLGGSPPATTFYFSWSSQAGAASYVLQVGSSTGAVDVYNSDVGNVLTKGLPLSAGTYYARVVNSTVAEQTVTVP